MTQVAKTPLSSPPIDLKTVVENRTREWHFHVYFLLQSPAESAAALALRDAVLRLRRDGEYSRGRRSNEGEIGVTTTD
jgi:DOPA 4,5-dioxygenase